MLLQERLGRFELRRPLGRGGMGDVYLAYDPKRDCEVALKLILLSTADPEILTAEKRGAQLQQQLSRQLPQVAAVDEYGEMEGFFYVAMEYIEGRDLSVVLQEGALPEDRAVRIALQLCEILTWSHGASIEIGEGRKGSIIHSDIKPANIRLQRGDRVRLLDFGVAKPLALSRKFTRNLFGSVPYSSPERLSRGVVDNHSDLWALAHLLQSFELTH